MHQLQCQLWAARKLRRIAAHVSFQKVCTDGRSWGNEVHTHKVIQIVVGWAQAAQIREKVGLKNCHVALMVLAWLMHIYEGVIASPIGVVAHFLGWAKDFKW